MFRAVVPDDARTRDDGIGAPDRPEQLGQRALARNGVVVHEPQPVGFVVGERHGHSGGEASGSAGVARQRHEVDEIAGSARDLGRRVGRCIVDDDHACERGTLGGERGEHLGQQVGAIECDDDRDDARWLR